MSAQAPEGTSHTKLVSDQMMNRIERCAPLTPWSTNSSEYTA